jgi:pimeloyl-ACP methyl ester carboxylesterase
MVHCPCTTISYPIPHDESGGTLLVYGKQTGSTHLILMCAGFPDDHSAFQPLAMEIAVSLSHCLVGVACLPGYDNRPEMPWKKKMWKEGYSFDDWVSCLREAVKTLRRYSTSNNQAKLTLCLHDWGCVAGLQFTNQSIKDAASDLIPDQLIILDVLLGPHPKTVDKPCPVTSKLTTIYTGVATASYWVSLATTWLLQRYVSSYLAGAYFALAYAVLFILRLTPGGAVDSVYLQTKSFDFFHLMYMAYPYFYVCKAILTNNPLRGAFLPFDLKRTPILYLYGTAKNFHFHDPVGLELLERESQQEGHRSRVVPIRKGGHWFYHQEPQQCLEHIQAFVNELTKA